MKKILSAAIATSFLLTACSETTSSTKENKSEAAEQVATNELTKKNIKFIVQKSIGTETEGRDIIKGVKISENGDVLIKIFNKNLTGLGDERSMQSEAFDIVKNLDEAKIKKMRDIRIVFNTTFVDNYGKESIGHYGIVAVSKKTRKQLQFDNLYSGDLEGFVDQYVFRK